MRNTLTQSRQTQTIQKKREEEKATRPRTSEFENQESAVGEQYKAKSNKSYCKCRNQEGKKTEKGSEGDIEK